MTASGPSTGRIASGAAKRPRGPIYVFTAVSLAVLLATVMIGRKQSDRFTATAVLVASSNGDGQMPLDGQAVLTTLQKPAHVQQVVDDLRRDDIVQNDDLDAAVIRRQVKVDSPPGRTGTGARFSVTYTASSSTSAMAIVNRLCNRYLHDMANKPDVLGVPAYRGDTYVAAARAAEKADTDHERAKAELEEFLTVNLGEPEGESNPTAEQSPLVARYDAVGLSRTDSPSESSVDEHALIARYQFLKRRVEETRSQQAVARRNEQERWERKFDDQPAIAWQVEPALSTDRQYSRIPPSRLALALSLGLVGGGCVVLARRGTTTMATVEQARAVLSVPIVGAVAEPTEADRQAPPRAVWPVRAALTASEWLLCVMLLAMILASLLDKNFAQHMRSEPLAALADGARCVVEIVWS